MDDEYIEDKPEETDEDEKSAKINEFRRKQQIGKKGNLVKKILIILFVCCILLAFWVLRRQILSETLYERIQISLADMNAGNGFPHSITGNEVLGNNFISSGKNIAVLSDTALCVLSPSGNIISQAQHKFISPTLKVSSLRWLMFDAGSRKYTVESISGEAISGESEKNIITGAIADNGKFAIASFADKYLTGLSVFMANGELQYTYSFASCYVTGIALDENGSHGVVTALFSDAGKLSSIVYMFDFNSPEPMKTYIFEDVMFSGCGYSEKNAVCIGENLVVTIDETTLESHISEKTADKINSYGIYNGYSVVSFCPYSGALSDTCNVYSPSAELLFSVESDSRIRDTDIYGDTVVILTDSGTLAYDLSTGEKINSYDTGSDALSIELSSADSAYILSLSEIRKIEIK